MNNARYRTNNSKKYNRYRECFMCNKLEPMTKRNHWNQQYWLCKTCRAKIKALHLRDKQGNFELEVKEPNKRTISEIDEIQSPKETIYIKGGPNQEELKID